MRKKSLFSILLIVFMAACIDRVMLDFEIPAKFSIVVDGMISDQPGPYTIELTRGFDIESKSSFKEYVSVKRVVISDNTGNEEELSEVSRGIYRTNADGIRGVVGRVYKLRIELLDDRIYESIPDSLMPAGEVERVYHQFVAEKTPEGQTTYGFDVFFDSNAKNLSSYRFLWKFVGTYQIETNPEFFTRSCGESRCPAPLFCSSYVLGPNGLEWVKPCECCTCWVNFFNTLPLVSDNQFNQTGRFIGVKATRVPINQWTFMHKVHAEIQQMSLSRNAFAFWKAIRTQKEAASNIFQPITGKIPSNFIQISGEKGPIEGLFFATSIFKNSVYISRNDISNQSIIPVQQMPFSDSCLKLFPFSTNIKPEYWEE
ncbi:MAG: DUF4249 family protein [Cyclobacteriaceae bacterium]|nr:DUF4249 family protein [Cyclobacteriaceae bacterium]UYN86496.1 MAG: DUF4249 family protein [Cyclobacteriaceae bacterium]